MKTGLFIFDLDGTLIDSKKDIKNSFNFAFKKNKIKIINDSFFKLNASRGSIENSRDAFYATSFHDVKRYHDVVVKNDRVV